MAWDWEAKDIDGTVHRLSEYRGKVVVMDFWYADAAGEGAHTQIKHVSETFRDAGRRARDVDRRGRKRCADRDRRDESQISDDQGQRIPPEKYGVTGYPTLVVIDRRGKSGGPSGYWRQDL